MGTFGACSAGKMSSRSCVRSRKWERNHIATEARGDHNEMLNRDWDAVSGYRWCPAQRRMESQVSQAGGQGARHESATAGKVASPNLRNPPGGKEHAARIFGSG